MGSVTRHWRWLACSALAIGCLLNPQPELPDNGFGRGTGDGNGGTGDGNGGTGGSSTSTVSGGQPGSSSGGVAGASQGSAGAPPSVGDDAGMGGALDLPAAGATGESGAAGASPAVGPSPH